MSYKGVGVQASRCAGVPRWYPGFRGAALRGVVAAPCLRAGRYGARSIKGEAVQEQRSTRAEAPSRLQPAHEVLPRADPRSFVSALEALLGPYSAALDSPQRLWGLLSAS